MSASVTVPGRIHEAETLWYAADRWPVWRDGFGHLAHLEGPWPLPGSVAIWDGVADGGRRRVIERCTAQEVRVGQTVQVEDSILDGVQRVAFTTRDRATVVTLTLEYRLKVAGPWPALREAARFNRPLRAGMERTLTRFARELAAEAELPHRD